ncbi:hypothetical protein CKAN_01722900 [Cinnamomum micranthum f. kanehirae]|uniref:Uncharacterized protein n=1 Tax=Cinnamomum micranthum f. kanehirae TaxID=337451 RepID=A0A443PBS6_9MAGN|nr:hypothetical protein CKAN_01722900 [Cinnamomum micranthum f. kanehirae]
MALLVRPVNLARVIEVLYQYRDEYTESTHETKERISLVLPSCCAVKEAIDSGTPLANLREAPSTC